MRRDRIRRKRGAREILDVVGNDYFRTCSRRGGQDVAVLRVVCHRGNQVFIAIDPRFRKMSPDFVPAVHGLLGREAEVLLKSSGYFYHDLIRPFRQKETWASGEPEQGSAKGIGIRTQASKTTGRALLTRRCRLWGIHSARTSQLRTHRALAGPAPQDAPCPVFWRIPEHHEDKRGAGCQFDGGPLSRSQAA
jgi:hypothetical protein